MVKKLFAGLSLGVCLFILSGTVISQGATIFVGSKNSNKYHYTECRSAKRIDSQNKIIFNSVKEAQSAGYIPCKVCKPPIKD